jgi:hypothetical protein
LGLKTKQRLYSALERKRTRQNQVAHQDSMRDNKLRAGPEDILSTFGELGIVIGELMRLGLARLRGKQFMLNTNLMRRSISAKRKRGGRPATGHDPMVGLRMSKDTRAAIKKWASTQHDRPNFSEAVRRLIEIGLKSLDEFE